MQDLNYLSQKIKQFLIILPVLLILLFSTCTDKVIWDYPLKDVKAKLKNSDFKFLYSIDFKKYSKKNVYKLGMDAPYYLYFIFKEHLDLKEPASFMLRLLMNNNVDGSWIHKGMPLLLNDLLENGLYKEAEKISGEYLKRFSSSGIFSPDISSVSSTGSQNQIYYKQQIQKAYIESLYLQKKDIAVLENTSNTFNDELKKMMPKLMLFKAVSSCRLNNPDWPLLFEKLFLNQKACEIHTRAYKFLMLKSNLFKQFHQNIKDLIHGKYYLLTNNRNKGITLLKQVIENIEPRKLAESTIIKELGFAYLYYGNYQKGAVYLDSITDSLPIPKRLEAIEMAGRLYKKAGSYIKGIERLRHVTNKTDNPNQKDRCLWFILSIKLSSSNDKALTEIMRTRNKWNDPLYFSDLLDKLITNLTARGNMDGLKALYYSMIKSNNDIDNIHHRNVSPQLLKRMLFILMRNGYMDDNNDLDSFNEVIETGKEQNQSAYQTLTRDYYQNINSCLKHSKEKFVIEGDDQVIENNNKSNENNKNNKSNMFASFVIGFFDFGLPLMGYDVIMNNNKKNNKHKSNNEISNQGYGQLLFEVAGRLKSKGYFLQAIRIMNIYFAYKKTPPTRKEWEVTYPQAFSDKIEKFSKKENIPPFLLYALVREESGFDPEIVSYAGAVGLAQLMPGTASDMARLMQKEDPALENPDLTNPDHNLALGARYFSRLYKRFKSVTKSLIAYNAGPTRLKNWKKQFTGYPDDLLVEAIPFSATRKYVKKIFVSSIFYAALYEHKKPDYILKYFYPDLKSFSSSVKVM